MIKLPIQEEHVSVRRTYLLLMKALLDLLAEMPFEKISSPISAGSPWSPGPRSIGILRINMISCTTA